jgi:hypothetical protein
MNRTRTKLLAAGQPVDRRHPLETGEVRLTTFVPLAFRRRGIRKVVVGPAGVEEPVQVREQATVLPPHPDPVLLRALGRGLYWQHLLETGVVADTAEIAAREGVHKSIVHEHLRLALLAPDLVETILAGQQYKTLTLERLMRSKLPLAWSAQRAWVKALGA